MMSETYNARSNAMATLSRRAAGAVAVFCVALLSFLPAHAVEIDINRGTVDPLPIAITDFVGGEGQEAKVGADISSVITNNLERSGLFRPLPKASFIERISDINVQPRFGDWRIIESQALVTGQTRLESDGRLRVEFRLWDVTTGRQLAGQRFPAALYSEMVSARPASFHEHPPGSRSSLHNRSARVGQSLFQLRSVSCDLATDDHHTRTDSERQKKL